jgi:transcriptional regulator with XRE-family HTH domain
MLNGMGQEVAGADFQRLTSLSGSFDDPEFRGSYIAHHLRAFIADQIRGLRGDMSQKEFGQLIGKPQSVVSRLENEEYGSVSLQTLIEIAIKLNIAFVGRFVDFPTFLRVTADFSENAVTPMPYSRQAMDALIAYEQRRQEPQGALEAFLHASYEQQKEMALARIADQVAEPRQQIGTACDSLVVRPRGNPERSSSSMSARGQSSVGALEPAA